MNVLTRMAEQPTMFEMEPVPAKWTHMYAVIGPFFASA